MQMLKVVFFGCLFLLILIFGILFLVNGIKRYKRDKNDFGGFVLLILGIFLLGILLLIGIHYLVLFIYKWMVNSYIRSVIVSHTVEV